MGESQIPPQINEPEAGFECSVNHGPLLPKIVELDVLRERQTDALLGKIIALLSCYF